MSEQPMIISGRRQRRGQRGPILRHALTPLPAGAGGAAAVAEFPGFGVEHEEDPRRTWITALISLFLHLGTVAVLLYVAAITRVIPEEMLPVQLLRDEPPPEAAPAPKALAERSSPVYRPAIQSVKPRVVNPQVVARAVTAVQPSAIQMDRVANVEAPTQVRRSTAVVERVAAVDGGTRIRAATVDVSKVSGPAVRGPVQIQGPVGPSVGPRKVVAAATGKTTGLAPVEIGGSGSSVESGVITGRDVEGSPAGVQVASVVTEIGDGYLGGNGGTGTGVEDSSPAERRSCFERPEVNEYLMGVRDRTIERWVLPPGISPDQGVTLNFRIDAAGSATRVAVVKASDNALGASAVDALRTAAPFPPMDEAVRCLSRHQIRATFTNPQGG